MANLHQINKKPRHDIFITPRQVIDKVKNVFGGEIDLDPCTMLSNPTGAKHFFSDFRNQDGILQDWSNYHSVFVNPAFSDMKTWVNKVCITESVPTILLFKFDIRTSWFNTIFETSDAVVGLKGNIKFENQFDGLTANSAAFGVGLALLHSPPLIPRFAKEFGNIAYRFK